MMHRKEYKKAMINRLAASVVAAAALAVASIAQAAFPTNIYTKVLTISNLGTSGSYDDFKVTKTGYEDLVVRLTYDQSLVGFYGMVKVNSSVAGAVPVSYIVKSPAEVTIATSNLTFTVSHTNAIPNGNHYMEVLLLDTATTNIVRSLGRGRFNVTDSLFDDAATNWSGVVVTSADYLTKVEGAATYLQTNDVDGTTIIYTNGALSAIAPAAPDAVARADISALKTGKVDRVDTNDWTVTSHAGLLAVEADTNALAQLATHTGLTVTAHGGLVAQAATNGWEVGAHTGYVPRSETGTLVNAGALSLEITPLEDATGALNSAVGVLQTATGTLNSAVAARITDAPSDGSVYGRSNANWVAVGAGGGTETDPVWTGSGHATNTLADGAHGGEADTLDSVLTRGTAVSAATEVQISSASFNLRSVGDQHVVGLLADKDGAGNPGSLVRVNGGAVAEGVGIYAADPQSIILGVDGNEQIKVTGAANPSGAKVTIQSLDGSGLIPATVSSNALDAASWAAAIAGGSATSIGLYSNATHVGSVTGLSFVGASALTVAGSVGTVTVPAGGGACTCSRTNVYLGDAGDYTQSIVATTSPPIYFGNEVRDYWGISTDGTNFTPPVARVTFDAQCLIGSAASAKEFRMDIYKNGATYRYGRVYNGGAAGNASPAISATVDNEAETNVWSLRVYHNDSTRSTIGSRAGTYCRIEWVQP